MRMSRYNVVVSNGEDAHVFNGLTGGLLRLAPEALHAVETFVETGAAAPAMQDTIVKAAAGGMIVEDDTDEIEVLRARYAASRHDRTRLGLTIVSSLGCNFDCPYCYEMKHPSILGRPVQEALLRLLDRRLSEIRSFAVTWFGGEPLVGKKPLYTLSQAFIDRCAAAGVAYDADIITNGYMLDRETCVRLAELHVRHAQVTLDGPAEIHDTKRPLVGGGGSFARIVQNLHNAVESLSVSVRVNIDMANAPHFAALLDVLQAEGLSGRLYVYPAQIVPLARDATAPSAGYGGRCFSKHAFAREELELRRMAAEMGFGRPNLPRPAATPCTAVREHELVVGSRGELFKCWYDVGNPGELIGTIHDLDARNSRLAKWLLYDPFSDPDCTTCIALPGCMGGCAAHALVGDRDSRCGTFRHSYREQVARYVEGAARAAVPA